MNDLSIEAIERFRSLWVKKSRNRSIERADPVQLMTDGGLLVEGQVTYAALVLLGSRAALNRLLAQCEVVFEYRASESPGPAQDRREFREGFFLFVDELWGLINLRNDKQHVQEGMFVYDIPTFNEAVVREALLNAIAHRDYRLGGSVFVRQFQRRLEIVSPGGFLPGVTAENALWKQDPRNRRIAEALQRCGLVERAGQGFDRMFEESIKQGKARPDFTGTDEHQVSVTLHGEVQDPAFLRYLERAGANQTVPFTTDDLLALDLIRHEERIPDHLKRRLRPLVERGVIELIGRGRGARHILSRDLYGALNSKGTYTRKRGLDRETMKELLLRHLRLNDVNGAPLDELAQVLPHLSKKSVQGLLRELKDESKAVVKGRTKAARWHLPKPGP